MTYSRNEIENLVRKAALGSGLDPGRAGDLAAAAGWLINFPLPVLAIFHHALTAPPGQAIALAPGAGHASCAAGAVARVGPAALDLLVAKPAGFEVILDAVDAPVIMAALAAVAARNHAMAFTLQTAGSSIVIGLGRPVDLAAIAEARGSRVILRRTEIVPRADDAAAPRPAAGPTRYDADTVGDDGFAALDRLARLTYVPASDHSRRAGAGAGLTDND